MTYMSIYQDVLLATEFVHTSTVCIIEKLSVILIN
jgi:hypothetical protein